MDWYLILKTIHIVSSTILFGTGMGIAFFMLRSAFTQNLHEKYFSVKNTVLADYVFTFPAVIVQPITGLFLIREGGYSGTDFWLMATYGLYVLAGLCWLPVVWIQIQLKTMAKAAVENNKVLPERYHKLFRIWFVFGWPAFLSLIVIFFLMVMKPV